MNRYDRQERVKQIGQIGQSKIRQATILIAGVGALGTYAAEQLTRAGIGHLILVDPDTVTLTNLQRQSLFTEADVASHKLKVTAAKEHLTAINSAVDIQVYPEPLTDSHLADLTFDLTLDCLDNYSARDLLNRAAIIHGFDYVFASCAGSFGNVMPISPIKHPCLNCAFPNLADLKRTDCDLIGVNTALVPLVSAVQVSVALHYLVDPSTVDFDHLITLDNWSLSQQKFQVLKAPDCPTCANRNWSVTKSTDQESLRVLCGTQTYAVTLSGNHLVTATKQLLAAHQIPFNVFKNFIQFHWMGSSMSLFKNGKLLLYGIADLQTADERYQQFKAALSTYQEVQSS